MEITEIFWMVLAGIAVATVYLWYTRSFLGKLVRKLIEIDACSPETAVTLSSIHCKLTPPLRLALREGGALYETVLHTENEGGETLYYLAPEKLIMTKSKYRNEGTTIFFLLLVVGLVVVLGLLFTYLYPLATTFLQGMNEA